MIYSQRNIFKKTFINYHSYIKSKAWSIKRKKRLKKDGFRCQAIELGKKCHSKNRLEVHHLTYDRLGNERISDLITLCHEHHQEMHLKN